MEDKAHRLTDEKLEEMEKRLSAHESKISDIITELESDKLPKCSLHFNYNSYYSLFSSSYQC